MRSLQVRRVAPFLTVALAFSAAPAALRAQGGRGAEPLVNAQAAAPVDFTGQWVAVVTEDWRYRMVTPAKGDYASVPLNAEGRKMADTWDPAKDEAAGNQCKSYGAAAVMRVPGRVRISWAGDETMKVETDAGTQMRTFYFRDAKSPGGDWQGQSQASWDIAGGGRGGPVRGGSLKVVTTKLKAGYLRKNGVPYSDKTVVTEYYDRTNEPDGNSWLVVTTVVDDPIYLNQPFITSTHFKKQNDQSGWNPTPCTAR
ncbi:MAG: hypothetical protein M3O20_09555 [Acidobacteriota bacterium]|nr:hypothetical protein [Acidobacteriota bacterium]